MGAYICSILNQYVVWCEVSMSWTFFACWNEYDFSYGILSGTNINPNKPGPLESRASTVILEIKTFFRQSCPKLRNKVSSFRRNFEVAKSRSPLIFVKKCQFFESINFL